MDYIENDNRSNISFEEDDSFEMVNNQLDVDGDCYFRIEDCFDDDGNFDYERLDDAIMSGEYVPEDW